MVGDVEDREEEVVSEVGVAGEADEASKNDQSPRAEVLGFGGSVCLYYSAWP